MCHKLRVVSILLMIGLQCCTSPYGKQLSDVESYIQERPDSALSVLESMDRSAITSSSHRAQYSLLYAMALDKNYIDTTDVGVIMPAVDYYGHHGPKDNLMKALFYLGRIQTNAGNYQDAMMSQMKAKSYADEIGDVYWKAMLSSALGYTYSLNLCVTGEISSLEDALELWKEYGDSARISIAMLNLARAYHNNNELEKSDSLYTITEQAGAKNALLYLAGNEMQRSDPNPEKAISLYHEAIARSVPFSIQDYYRYAYALELGGESESCKNIMSQLESYQEDMRTDYWRYKIAEHQSSYKDAFGYLKAYTAKSDSIVRAQLDQSVYQAQSDYYHLDAQYSEARRRAANLRLFAYGLISLLVILILLATFQNRQKRIQKRNEDLSIMYEEAQQMIASIRIQEDLSRKQSESELKELESKLFSLRSSFAKMYQSQFDTIARLLENRKDAVPNFDAAKEQYAARVSAVLSDIRKGEKGQKEFERLINSELDGIMTKLRTDYSNFKESDFRVLSYLVVGFDATTRSFILGGTANNMRVMKNRLLTYIKNHPTENEELYKVFLLS